jgi:two-component system, LytTR family, sensor kinase
MQSVDFEDDVPRRPTSRHVAYRDGTARRIALLWPVSFAVATVMGVGFALQHAALAAGAGGVRFTIALATQLPPFYAWALLTPLIVEALLRLQRRRLIERVAAHVALAAVLVAAVEALLVWPTVTLGYYPGGGFADVWRRLLVVRGASDLVFFGLIVAVVHAVLHARRARAEELERSIVAQQALRARLAALRGQLEPHFLLNTLNGISALAAAGEKEATERAIAATGDLLREALRRPDIVTVAQELEYLELYLVIVRLSRPDAAAVRIRVARDVEACTVPSFVLQPLVENAFRHGSRPRNGAAPAEVRIERADGTLALSVRNPVGMSAGQGDEGADGIGMANTRQRLDSLYGGNASLTATRGDRWFEVRVVLPASAT